jgi:hypothetical protein
VSENGGLKTFYLVRGYTLLVFGLALVVYGIVPPIDPAIFALGGGLLGLQPVLKSQEKIVERVRDSAAVS